jgi:glutathione peroxidase
MTSTYDSTADAPTAARSCSGDDAGKVLHAVNVASKYGLTAHSAGLQPRYLETEDRGLQILGFPLQPVHGARARQWRRDPGLLHDHLRHHPRHQYLRAQAPGDFDPA